MAGLEWLRSYRSRNLDLSLKKPESCSLARATAFNKDTVKMFFDNLKNVMERHPSFGNGCRIYNLDETATTTVQKPLKVIAPKGRQNICKITSGEKGTLVTTCAIVCASGQALPPALVFPRKNLKDYMMTGAPIGSLGLANPTLLIMDNHESHLSIEALDMAKRSGVTILTLHPHTTSKMQPLDVGLIGPFKAYYNSAVDSWLMRNPGKQMTIYNIAECVGYAYAKSMTPVNITSAFKKCGIFPFDADVFSEIDFMPSAVTDRDQPETSSAKLMAAPSEQLNDRKNLVSPSSDITCAHSPILFEENPSEDVGGNNTGIRSAESPSLLESTTPEHIMALFEAQNSQSPSSIMHEVLKDTGDRTFKSPKEFMLSLKSGPRAGRRKPRKLGKSMIATDTPEKNQIAEERKKTRDKKSAASAIKRPILQDKNFEEPRKKKKAKKVVIPSDPETSEEENFEVIDLSESDISGREDEDEDLDADNLPMVNENFRELERKPKCNDYVLVSFNTKKDKNILCCSNNRSFEL
ncbi:unnamed protein product [Parnassius apollo]|uniref:(apollo) hypothetical protein n=1 Tax=Parnassius apollo TaxID=110799 RepID=A0A8S3WCA8_PARAO|nr:unnamed protein product [Parnassius apollo]